MKQELLTVGQFADRMGLSRHHCYRLIKQEVILPQKIKGKIHIDWNEYKDI